MKVPFSPPHIDDETIARVVDVLKSGWITTGPRTKEFERQLADYCGAPRVLCVNSNSAGMELMLHWFGISDGDEVIIPAYTYTATANVVVHCGAKPVMVDVGRDFNINVEKIRAAITPRTKAIIPVDIAGFPCDYDAINALVRETEVRKMFAPRTKEQELLGRIFVLSDAAHSVGGRYKGKRCGVLTDCSVFSFHAVKNLTTAEGGAICLNLPAPFDHDELYKLLCTKSLHGQNKDALAKTQIGNWRYDVIEAGYKCNMTDILASIGLGQLAAYESETLPKRRHIFQRYTEAFRRYDIFEIPPYETAERSSSLHVYPLRVKGISEAERDQLIAHIFSREVAVNVHFIPLPMLSFYKNRGYNIADFPTTYDNFSREISLPVFQDISEQQIDLVIDSVLWALSQMQKLDL